MMLLTSPPLRSLILVALHIITPLTDAYAIPKRDGNLGNTTLPATSTHVPSNGVPFAEPGTEFLHITCTPNVTDLGKNPVSRWKAALADQALTRINRNWNENPDVGGSEVRLTYVNAMMNLLGKPEQNCGLEIDSCDFSSLGCTDVDNPGDWLVLRSLTNYHKFHLNLYTAMNDARGSLSSTMTSFVSTFAPGKPEESLFDKILDNFAEGVFDFIIGQALGPLHGLIDQAVKEGADIIKDAVDTGVDQLKSLAKEASTFPEGLTQDEKKDNLVETLQALSDRYSSSISDSATKILSGSSQFLPNFSSQLESGAWVFDQLVNAGSDLYNMQLSLRQAFSAMLLSPAWKMADSTFPMILVKNEQCFGGDPTNLMDDDIVHAGGSCAVEGKTMWLVSYSGHICPNMVPTSEQHSGPLVPRQPCTAGVFKKLPGYDSLEDQTGGISKDAVIRSSWNAYQANGGKNGFALSLDGSAAGGLFSSGVETPGLYQIPICDIDEAIQAYNDKPGGQLCDYGGW